MAPPLALPEPLDAPPTALLLVELLLDELLLDEGPLGPVPPVPSVTSLPQAQALPSISAAINTIPTRIATSRGAW
jgi:hypothetical protein